MMLLPDLLRSMPDNITCMGTAQAGRPELPAHNVAVVDDAARNIPDSKQDQDQDIQNTSLSKRTAEMSADALEDSVKSSLEDAFKEFCRDDIDNETVSLMDPHGILGLILKEMPGYAIPLLNARINALKADMESWWTGKRAARQALRQLEEALGRKDPDTLLEELHAFEKLHGKIPFQTIIHGRFVKAPAIMAAKLLTPIKPDFEMGVMADIRKMQMQQENCLALLGSDDECLDMIADKKIPAPDSAHGGWQSKAHVLDLMLQHAHEPVGKLLFAKCNYDIRDARIRIKAGEAIDPERVKTLSGRLRQVVDIQSGTQSGKTIRDFLDDPANEELKEYIEEEAAQLYYRKVYVDLLDLDPSGMSVDELKQFSTMYLGMTRLQKQLELPPALYDRMNSKLAVLPRALELARLMITEKDTPEKERVFRLRAPTIGHIISQLESGQGLEFKLYTTLERYMQRLRTFMDPARRDYRSMVSFQQARFDLRVQQEELVMHETRGLVAGDDNAVVMSPGSYEKNIELLADLEEDIQRTVPVRPVFNGREAFVTIGMKHFWRDRTTLNEKKAELQHIQDLRACNYQFKAELEKFCRCVPGSAKAIAASAVKIAAPTKEQLDLWQEGKGSLWELLDSGAQSYKLLEVEARKTLEVMLHEAKRNPKQFRRLIGDSCQTLSQLSMLVGAGGSGLVSELQTRLTAESAASTFSGDVAVIEDIDYASNKKLRDQLCRFKFLCQMAEAALAGTTAANAVRNATSNTYTSMLGAIIGGAVGLVTTGLGGAVTGYHLGGYAGSALVTAIYAGGACGIRRSVNSMTGETVRTLDKVLRDGPMFATTYSTADEVARIGRYIAEGESTEYAAAHNWFRPVIFRLNKVWEAILEVRAHPRQLSCWFGLTKEVAKCGLLLGASALLSSGIFTCSLLSTLGIVYLATSVGSIAAFIVSSHYFCSWFNAAERTAAVCYNSVSEYRSHLFDKDSDMARDVEEHCRVEGERLLAGMTGQLSYKQYMLEDLMHKMVQEYWHQWKVKNPAQAATYEAGVAQELADTATARMELAAKLDKQHRALQLLKRYSSQFEHLQRDDEAFSTFQAELEQLDIALHIDRPGVQYFILNQIKELTYSLERQCGTASPGDTESEIYKTLTDYHHDIYLGPRIPELIKLETAEQKEAFRVFKQRVTMEFKNKMLAVTTGLARMREELLLDSALTAVAREKSLTEFSDEKMTSREARLQTRRKLAEEAAKFKEVIRIRASEAADELKKNPLVQHMTPLERSFFIPSG